MLSSLTIIPIGLNLTLSCNYHIFENANAFEKGRSLSKHDGRKTNLLELLKVNFVVQNYNLIVLEIAGHPLSIVGFRAPHFLRQIQEHRKSQEPNTPRKKNP